MLPASGTRGHDLRGEDPGEAEADDQHQQDSLQPQQRPHVRVPADRRRGGQRQHRAADRERGGAGEGDDAVVAGEEPRRGQPVNRQQRGHRREGGADQHGAAIAALHADNRQRHGGARGEPGADRDRQEVHRAVDLDLLGAEEVKDRDRADGAATEHDEHREASLSQQCTHTPAYRANRP